ncbi:MAG: VWA domain-containing protein [Pyrinomonadaceae bacterium]
MKTLSPQSLALASICLALAFSTLARAQQPRHQPSPTPRPTPRAQQTPPATDEEEIIRLNTELVQLRAVVTDRKGQLVTDLKKEDFEVFENNQPREVSFFSVESAPSAGTDATPTTGAPAVVAARPPTGSVNRAAPARVVVLFVDTLHLSPASLVRAKDQLKRFVDEQLTDSDVAAVVTTSGTLGSLQQFMSDRRMLKYAIDKITLFARPHTYFTPYLAGRVVIEDPDALKVAAQVLTAEEGFQSIGSPGDRASNGYIMARARQVLEEERNLRRATFGTLAAVCERLAPMPGQRLVAFVSDGLSLADDGGGEDREGFSRATGAAARAGVVVYTFNAEGLEGPAEFSARSVPQSPEFGMFMSASRLDVQGTLREVADVTGGEAYINTNNMRASLGKMVEANRVYYSLAYYLPKDSDKKFRKIVVRVRNHPDYKVRTQKGYAPPEKPAPEAGEATPNQKLFQKMIAPLPATAVGVTSSADFLETADDDAQVTLQVHIDAASLRHEKKGDDEQLHCLVAGVVFDREGKIADQFSEAVEATLTPAQFEEARRTGYRYVRRLKLKPGLYQVRVGVREVGSELVGTSSSWVEVPAPGKGAPVLSSLFLGAQPGGAKNAVGSASIRSGDTISYRLVAYGAQEGASVRVEVLQGEKPVFQGDWQPLAARTLRTDAKGAELGGQLRLPLPPGIYALRVSVRPAANSKKIVEREADFEIEP